MEKDVDKVGIGEPQLEIEHHGGASMPGTPGYESEGAFRHANAPEAEIREIRSTQLVPGPLDETETGPALEPTTLRFNQPTKHDSR